MVFDDLIEFFQTKNSNCYLITAHFGGGALFGSNNISLFILRNWIHLNPLAGDTFQDEINKLGSPTSAMIEKRKEGMTAFEKMPLTQQLLQIFHQDSRITRRYKCILRSRCRLLRDSCQPSATHGPLYPERPPRRSWGLANTPGRHPHLQEHSLHQSSMIAGFLLWYHSPTSMHFVLGWRNPVIAEDSPSWAGVATCSDFGEGCSVERCICPPWNAFHPSGSSLRLWKMVIWFWNILHARMQISVRRCGEFWSIWVFRTISSYLWLASTFRL